MQMTDIITKKKQGLALTKDEIKYFVQGYADNIIPDYQISSLMMAIYFNGMNKEEISNLTDAMMHSGDVCDLSSIKGIKIDKHSTGGVGDKTSLVLGPLVASCGVKVAKMSGRGLGHTGGTLDKLESIPGLSISVSENNFIKQVNEIGIAIIGQTANLVPADKKMYALRDVTATVDSIPLISASIMSKKLASGSDTILLDVKFGSGAFMKDINSARELARTMVDIGNSFKRDTRAVLTDMDQPLGKAIGNSLEVIEACETLKGNGPKDLLELCLSLGAIILAQAKIESDENKARELLMQKINSGEAFNKLKELVSAQGGDASYLDNYTKFDKAKNIVNVYATSDGYVKSIHALNIGESAMHLGAGRQTKNDIIDMSAGIYLNKKIGDKVNNGDLLATLYTNKNDIAKVEQDVLNAFEISEDYVNKNKLIYEIIK